MKPTTPLIKKLVLLTLATTSLIFLTGCACFDPWFSHGHHGGGGGGHHNGHHGHGHHDPYCD